MSEFQYYEFVAIDRPRSPSARKRLRAITSRATITSTRLANTYEWGDFKGDPHDLVAKYFDAFLYLRELGYASPHVARPKYPARSENREAILRGSHCPDTQ